MAARHGSFPAKLACRYRLSLQEKAVTHRRTYGRPAAADLEELLRVAWGLMTPGQRAAFRQHPDVLGVVEAAGGSPAQP